MKEYKVPVQSLIDHIKTAIDVDPWAKEMAEELLKELGSEKKEAIEPDSEHHLFVCPVCRSVLRRNQKFCHECGRPVLWKGR